MFDPKEELIACSKGNPGALKVLISLLEKDYPDHFMMHLFLALRLTDTPASNLWVVYKDLSDFDLDKTKDMLTEWFNSSAEPLGVWLKRMKGVEYAEI